MSDIRDSSKGRLLTLADLREYKPPPAYSLIRGGVLNIGSRMVIFGDEGTFKSAAATHAGFCLSRGSSWLGFKTTQANILYIQGEMSVSETKERIEQYIEGSGAIYSARPGSVPNEAERLKKYKEPDNLVVETLTDDVNLDTISGYNFIRNELELMITHLPARPIVLICDPLFKMFRYDLIKEEDLKSMTSNIDKLRKDTSLFAHHPGMAVIIVHHARKAQVDAEGNRIEGPGSTDMFGSAHLKWWADTIMKFELDSRDETESTVEVKFTKHRLMRYPPPKLIKMFWDRETYHPYIQTIIPASKGEDYREFRGVDLNLLE